MAEGFQVKFEDSISTIRRSLEFLGQRSEEFSGTTMAKEAQDQIQG